MEEVSLQKPQEGKKRNHCGSSAMVRRLANQSGQAIVEYVLLIGLSVLLARFIFFHPEFGIYGILNNGMMRLGSALELNLKSGTASGPPGRNSTDPFAGVGSWEN